MSASYLLGLDVGTSACKAQLLDLKLHRVERVTGQGARRGRTNHGYGDGHAE